MFPRLPHGTLTAVLSVTLLTAGVTAAEDGVQFETHVRPILEATCTRCHNGQTRKGELNLTTVETLLRGGQSGLVVSLDRPDESLLLRMVLDGEMPPEGEPLTTDEVEMLRRWISDGQEIRERSSAPAISQDRIVPLMLLRCAPCHGGRRREAELDLRTKAGMLRGGKSGPAVVPGQPEESLLLQRIRHGEMPPRRQLVSVSVKPMEPSELQLLEQWIAAGLPESTLHPDALAAASDPLVSDKDRQFWSFQPPRDVPVPVDGSSSEDRREGENPIDFFVAAKLQEHGLAPAPEADRVTLVRRLHFDLLGLPPTPEEVASFLADMHPLAYERLVERLLASPRYGERWGRHWLDVAGYADSEGAQNEDRVRPSMWRYRDYVVRAFNADKPYDRFLQEQLAGDELANYEQADAINEEIYDNLVATGFLRTAPDRTFADITNFVPDRLELIADEIQILGSAVMGLTLHCARCHSHKFDPLPQRDYYRLAAVLKDALDEHDWLKPEDRSLNYVLPSERQQWEAEQNRLNDQVAALKRQLEAADATAKAKLAEQLKQLEATRAPEPRIRALWSRGEPSPTYILLRGNYLTPGREVMPGVPAVLLSPGTAWEVSAPWPGAKATGRRLALARWLTHPEHPLTARVFVNRVWHHHFGRGIVASLANFGVTGEPPTHPELLDWLAREFVRQDWSLKSLHRLLVTSRTYRQSSQPSPASLRTDPENRLLSHLPVRRMEAEVLRDSLLLVAGRLNETPYGPADDVDVREDGLVTPQASGGGWRRSIYVLHRRTKLPTILESFDSPQMGPNCVRRGESIVAPQALHLLNNALVYELAREFAERVRREAGGEPLAQIKYAHQLALGRPPAAEELEVATQLYQQLTEEWLGAVASDSSSPTDAAHRALQNYCHAIMNSGAFLYVD